MIWQWLAIGLGAFVLLGAGVLLALHFHIMWKYLGFVVRIFQEKPLFIVPRGQPLEDAETIRFSAEDGRTLAGVYLKSHRPRRGVILFGLEFGSNAWACVPYCDFLRREGYDVFAFEPRGQGDSDPIPGYEPLQWVTDHEVSDFRAALAYLKGRPDADPQGVGFFGISKGGGAGLLAAARDPYIRCCVTDGIFATRLVMVPYMRNWLKIYSNHYILQYLAPDWYYAYAARKALRIIRRQRGCTFPDLEKALPRLAGRPLLMIHGGADNYIKPEMASRLFDYAREPKEFWLVPGAKHNQAFHVANGEYQRRLLAFFDNHLATASAPLEDPSRAERAAAEHALLAAPSWSPRP